MSVHSLDQLKEKFNSHVKNLQDEITAELSKVDQTIELIEDLWERVDAEGNPGGGGRTRAFQ